MHMFYVCIVHMSNFFAHVYTTLSQFKYDRLQFIDYIWVTSPYVSVIRPTLLSFYVIKGEQNIQLSKKSTIGTSS